MSSVPEDPDTPMYKTFVVPIYRMTFTHLAMTELMTAVVVGLTSGIFGEGLPESLSNLAVQALKVELMTHD